MLLQVIRSNTEMPYADDCFCNDATCYPGWVKWVVCHDLMDHKAPTRNCCGETEEADCWLLLRRTHVHTALTTNTL